MNTWYPCHGHYSEIGPHKRWTSSTRIFDRCWIPNLATFQICWHVSMVWTAIVDLLINDVTVNWWLSGSWVEHAHWHWIEYREKKKSRHSLRKCQQTQGTYPMCGAFVLFFSSFLGHVYTFVDPVCASLALKMPMIEARLWLLALSSRHFTLFREEKPWLDNLKRTNG